MRRHTRCIALSIPVVLLIASLASAAGTMKNAAGGDPIATPLVHLAKPAPIGTRSTFTPGDVFAGVGGGNIAHLSNTGTLIEYLNTGSGSTEETGMGFDVTGNLYTTNFEANDCSKFDNTGTLVQHPWGSGFNLHPESVAFDGAHHVFIGQADGTTNILEFDESGTPIATFVPAPDARGTDWIDLAADQCTMYYCSEGTHINRFDICTNTQLAPFVTVPTSPCFAVRQRPNGDVMVAAYSACHLFDSSGALLRSYPTSDYGETSFFFAMNLDQDGVTFWTAGFGTGNIYRIRIADGGLVTQFNAPIVASLAGLAIAGEIRTSQNAPQFDSPPTPTCGSTQTVEAGQNLSFTVQASDLDPLDPVTLTSSVLPAGATMTPALPQTGNPVSSTFSWTPTVADIGSRTVDFTATDANDRTATCSYTIEVTPPSNSNPDCSNASATTPILWPPNHTYRAIGIDGVTDPDGDPVTITVTGVTQDEPVNSHGDGTTCPDAQIVDGQASVRAERAGTGGHPGNGRVYAIRFTATDGRGGSCKGTVNVCVPHDIGNATCVDDGQRYSSLGPCTSTDAVAVESVDLKVRSLGANVADLAFAVPHDARVQIAVFDVSGRRLATIADESMQQGTYEREWNMSGVSKGLYFVRLNVDGVSVTRTLVKLH